MRLNDIVKGLVLGTALYAAGCGGTKDETCSSFCDKFMRKCAMPDDEMAACIRECVEDSSTYDPETCFSCYDYTASCASILNCMENNCGGFH